MHLQCPHKEATAMAHLSFETPTVAFDIMRVLPNDRPHHVVLGLEHQDVMLVVACPAHAWATSSISAMHWNLPFSQFFLMFIDLLLIFEFMCVHLAPMLLCEVESSVGCSAQCGSFFFGRCQHYDNTH